MCNVLLDLLLLINKKGRAVLTLARASVEPKSTEPSLASERTSMEVSYLAVQEDVPPFCRGSKAQSKAGTCLGILRSQEKLS